jgi:hypothetical protein
LRRESAAFKIVGILLELQAAKANALAKKGEEEYIFQLVDTLKEYLGSLTEKVPQ